MNIHYFILINNTNSTNNNNSNYNEYFNLFENGSM